MSDETEQLVVIKQETLEAVKVLLKATTRWLDRDARYAHPNAKIRAFHAQVYKCQLAVEADETEFRKIEVNRTKKRNTITDSDVEFTKRAINDDYGENEND